MGVRSGQELSKSKKRQSKKFYDKEVEEILKNRKNVG